MSELPEELLQTLIEILAYNFDFIERHDPQFRWKCARTELVSLSVVNRRLRRLCLPFLFAYIEIQGKDLEVFSTQCAASDAFALSVRTLTLNGLEFGQFYEHQKTSLLSALPHLMNLSQINLEKFAIDQQLLSALQHHPVSSVLLNRLEESLLIEALTKWLPSEPSAMEKIVIKRVIRTIPFQPQFLQFLAHGLQVRRLEIASHNLARVVTWRFHGLHELLYLSSSDDLSWLPEFARIHPLLRKISFTLPSRQGPFLAFVLPFLEKIRANGLDVDIASFAITRALSSDTQPATGTFTEWHVTGMHLKIERSMGQILHAAQSLFPRISVLTVNQLVPSVPLAPIDLIAFLSLFSSLQVLTLFYTLEYLDFRKPELPWETPPTIATHGPVEAEAALISYTGRIALAIPSIEAIYILEKGPFDGVQTRVISGWLNAHQLRNIDPRDMAGTLEFIPSSDNPRGYQRIHSNTVLFV